MTEMVVGHLHLRWEPADRLLFVKAAPERAAAVGVEELKGRLGVLLAGTPHYSVVVDAQEMAPSNHRQVTFWFSFLVSFQHPRRVAVFAADGQKSRAFDIFGSLVRVPIRVFPAPEQAIAWAREG